MDANQQDYDEPADLDPPFDDGDLPPYPAKTYYCTLCGQNAVDVYNGYDTCEECLARQ